MKLGNQFLKSIKKQLKRDANIISDFACNEIGDDLDKRLPKGQDVQGKQFVGYAEQTRQDRRRLGIGAQKRPVTLQRILKRVRLWRVEKSGQDGAKLTWQGVRGREGKTFGEILFHHQKGDGKNPTRLILAESDSQVKKSITDKVSKFASKALNVKLGK